MYIEVTSETSDNWDRVLSLFDRTFIESAFNRIRRKLLRQLAELYLEKLRAAMTAGEALGPALSAEWAAKKGHSKPWVWKEEILRNLTITPLQNGELHAGLPLSAKSDDGKELALIAMILEIGSYNVPARPIFEPVGRALEEDAMTLEALVEYHVSIEFGQYFERL